MSARLAAEEYVLTVSLDTRRWSRAMITSSATTSLWEIVEQVNTSSTDGTEANDPATCRVHLDTPRSALAIGYS